MTYTIVIDEKTLAQLAKLPKKIRRQIANKIDKLASNPRVRAVRELPLRAPTE